eukprot:1377047-Rhodomonas_salina.3
MTLRSRDRLSLFALADSGSPSRPSELPVDSEDHGRRHDQMSRWTEARTRLTRSSAGTLGEWLERQNPHDSGGAFKTSVNTFSVSEDRELVVFRDREHAGLLASVSTHAVDSSEIVELHLYPLIR